MFKLASGFRDGTVEPLRDIHVDDADWTNAFGTTLKGRAQILDYLRHLFADERFTAGELVGQPQASVRFVRDDTAVVKTYAERRGQETVERGVLPTRHNHSLKVVVKQGGHWLIVSELYSDAREEQTLLSAAE